MQRKSQLALEILLEEKKKGDDLGDTEKKEFKPRFDAKRLEDYGAKPDESFCKIWKMGIMLGFSWEKKGKNRKCQILRSHIFLKQEGNRGKYWFAKVQEGRPTFSSVKLKSFGDINQNSRGMWSLSG